jgi:hypothetical protein
VPSPGVQLKDIFINWFLYYKSIYRLRCWVQGIRTAKAWMGREKA